MPLAVKLPLLFVLAPLLPRGANAALRSCNPRFVELLQAAGVQPLDKARPTR